MNRRNFLQHSSVLGAAALFGISESSSAEPPPETTRIRMLRTPALCFAPQYLAEEFFHLEGFTDIQYVKLDVAIPVALVKTADLAMFGGPTVIPAIDAGLPIVTLAGIHQGCWELIAADHVQSVHDLPGKRVAIVAPGGVDHIWLSSILAYVGVDPRTQIRWVHTGTMAESQRQFVDGRIDAFIGFPPQPQDLRRQGIGKVIVNTTHDQPWSQYFCCMVAGQRDFVRDNPIATKRALRAILKAADVCSQSPERAAQLLVTKGYATRYDVALEVLKDVSYSMWRTHNPEDTFRFHGLRLREVGMVKSTPEQIIAQGTNWRFLNELKKELKT